MPFPFPFFGSGSASYFEWFEMWIWFEKPVPKKERARLLKGAPGPCKEDASWPLPNLLWASNGDQFIGGGQGANAPINSFPRLRLIN